MARGRHHARPPPPEEKNSKPCRPADPRFRHPGPTCPRPQIYDNTWMQLEPAVKDQIFSMVDRSQTILTILATPQLSIVNFTRVLREATGVTALTCTKVGSTRVQGLGFGRPWVQGSGSVGHF